MTRWILLSGALFALTTVMIGAFGAHSLKAVLDAKAMGWIDTGTFYQALHAMGLLACGFLPQSKSTNITGILFIAGISLFCGSLYLMALTGVTKLGIVTPIGGVCFLAGWLSFCRAVWTIGK